MRAVIAILAVLSFALMPLPALAHGDVPLVNRQLVLAPLGSASFDASLHYHRLVGRIEADGPVSLVLLRSDDGSVALRRAPSPTQRINDLVRCCDDAGWTAHRLVIRNELERPVLVDATFRLVHDDLAVMVYGAESFTAESVVILGAIWTAALWHTLRRPAARRLRSAALIAVSLFLVVGGLGLLGAVRYGVAGAPGYLAALSEIPVLPANPVASGVSLLLFVTMLAWAWGGRRWVGSAGSGTPAAWSMVGAAYVGSVIATAIVVASAYGTWLMPIATAVAAAGPAVVFGIAAQLVRARS